LQTARRDREKSTLRGAKLDNSGNSQQLVKLQVEASITPYQGNLHASPASGGDYQARIAYHNFSRSQRHTTASPASFDVPLAPLVQSRGCFYSFLGHRTPHCELLFPTVDLRSQHKVPAPETPDIRLIFNPEVLSNQELEKLAQIATAEALEKLQQALDVHENRLIEIQRSKTGRNEPVGAQKKRISLLQKLIAGCEKG
jgi:hypothetical protein